MKPKIFKYAGKNPSFAGMWACGKHGHYMIGPDPVAAFVAWKLANPK